MTRVVIHREPIDPGEIVRNRKGVAAWKRRGFCCWICGENNARLHEVHHIVGGSHRSDEPCNFALFCRKCHAFIETLEPLSSVRICLWYKRLFDPENYDKRRVEDLFGRRVDQ